MFSVVYGLSPIPAVRFPPVTINKRGGVDSAPFIVISLNGTNTLMSRAPMRQVLALLGGEGVYLHAERRELESCYLLINLLEPCTPACPKSCSS